MGEANCQPKYLKCIRFPARRKPTLWPLQTTSPQTHLSIWITQDLGVRAFQGLGKNGPWSQQVVRQTAHDKDLPSGPMKVCLHRECLPGCSWDSSRTRDIKTPLRKATSLSSQHVSDHKIRARQELEHEEARAEFSEE